MAVNKEEMSLRFNAFNDDINIRLSEKASNIMVKRNIETLEKSIQD
jgi:hypothetical protein